VAKRSSRILATDDYGVPLFLQQLVDTLRLEYITPDATDPVPIPAATEVGRAAALHGAELLRSGYTVDPVIHDYVPQRGAIPATSYRLVFEGIERELLGKEFRLDEAIGILPSSRKSPARPKSS
jgi:hypothetical protein